MSYKAVNKAEAKDIGVQLYEQADEQGCYELISTLRDHYSDRGAKAFAASLTAVLEGIEASGGKPEVEL